MNQEETQNLSNSSSTSSQKSTFKEILKEILIFGAIAIGIVMPFRIYIAEPYLVDGRSMSPTFETADYLIVDKINSGIGKLDRNSVVVFKYPDDTSKSFIKRIIGLPGETVKIEDNKVTIVNNDHPEGFGLDQSYIVHKSVGSYEKTLDADEYFVMGDNRAESFDSRSWGPLPQKDILGKPILRLFPFTKISFMPGELKN